MTRVEQTPRGNNAGDDPLKIDDEHVGTYHF